MKVALVTDSITQFGGAHRFLVSLCKLFPKSDIFTAIYDKRVDINKELSGHKIFSSFLGHPFLRPIFKNHYTILSPLAFESFDFSKYNLVISITAGAAKGIITPVSCKHVNIILTPVRYYWKLDNPDFYTKNIGIRKLFKPIFAFTDAYVRQWDFAAAKRPDVNISISSYISTISEKIYGIKSDILAPPVELNVKPDTTSANKLIAELSINNQQPINDFYIIVTRLYPYKRADLAILAFKRLRKHLLIVGSGPEEKSLKKLAGNSKFIHFLQFLPDGVMYALVKAAKGFIHCGIEDFGIAMVESIFLSTPVIAYDLGGASDIVKKGVSGMLFKSASALCVKRTVEEFEGSALFKSGVSAKVVAEYKDRYSLKTFKEGLEKQAGIKVPMTAAADKIALVRDDQGFVGRSLRGEGD
ncbi:glycosyltransferase [Candidatus Dojkabacteria bacterium]|nr:glycosyltransferase [Candidatus Dojkabacteria bacterium]